MTFTELGEIEDPFELMDKLTVSPMLVRYMVQTAQLETRYPGVQLPELLDAIDIAVARVQWPIFTVGQTLHLAEHNPEIEKYLDEIQSWTEQVLKTGKAR
jgi:hypothetical protein